MVSRLGRNRAISNRAAWRAIALVVWRAVVSAGHDNKFPATNVVEALAQISGVTLNRNVPARQRVSIDVSPALRTGYLPARLRLCQIRSMQGNKTAITNEYKIGREYLLSLHFKFANL
jgi:hypothetical protein